MITLTKNKIYTKVCSPTYSIMIYSHGKNFVYSGNKYEGEFSHQEVLDLESRLESKGYTLKK